MTRAWILFHDIRHRETEIEQLRETIAEHMAQLSPQSPRYDSQRVQTTPVNRTEAAIIQVNADAERLNRLKIIQGKQKSRAQRLINTLDSESMKMVMTLFYFSRKSTQYQGLTLPMKWADVSAAMGYSTSHCKRLHRLAMNAIDKYLTNGRKA